MLIVNIHIITMHANMTWALSFSGAAICSLALTVVLTWVVELAVVLLGCRALGPQCHLKVLTLKARNPNKSMKA